MSSQFAGRLWKWIIPAGIVVGLMGLWVPAQADDEKVEIKIIKKDGERKEEERKDEERREAKKEERKEEDRKEEGRKEELRREESRIQAKKGEGQGHNDARIDELARFVKQLAGQVNELREEVRGLRSGGFGPGASADEYRKRMEEMAKKFGAANPAGISPEKMKEEMERRFRADKERFARDTGDAEVQIRREIEKLQAELKRITAAREGGDEKEPKKEGDRKEGGGGDKKEDGDRKEGDKKEVKDRDSKEDKKEDKEEDKKEDDK